MSQLRVRHVWLSAIAGFAILATTATSTRALLPSDKLPAGTIAQAEGFSKISFYNGRLVWSDRVGPQYSLMTSIDGSAPAQVPIAPASAPFDVDLGPDETGNTVAVYSRCTGGPPEPACDIYKFDFAAGKESAISTVNTDRSETLPSIWGSRIAFLRSCRGETWCKPHRSRVYLARVGVPGSDRPISPIRMRLVAWWTGNPKVVVHPFADARAVELHGKQVAFVVNTWNVEWGNSHLFLYAHGRSRLVYRAYLAPSGGSHLESPSFGGGAVYVPELGYAELNDVVRYLIAKRRAEFAPTHATSTPVPGDGNYLSGDYGGDGDSLGAIAAGKDGLFLSRFLTTCSQSESCPQEAQVIYRVPLPAFRPYHPPLNAP